MYAKLEQKKCTKCQNVKSLENFAVRKRRKSGFASWCSECLNEWRRKDKIKTKNKYQDYEFARGLKRFYGLTVHQYESMLLKQNGCCDCCGIHESKFKRRLHVDHDHETGKIRALLCTECNPGLGYFKHSIERLELAVQYLKKFKR